MNKIQQLRDWFKNKNTDSCTCGFEKDGEFYLYPCSYCIKKFNLLQGKYE